MLVTQLGASSGLSGRAGVYVVRDDAGGVLYVGQSKDTGRRLQQHRRAASAFGQAIRAAPLLSAGWRVALLDIGECAKVTGKPCRDLDDAEAAMIETMSPAYNTQHNASGKTQSGNFQIGSGLADNVRAAVLAIGRSRVYQNG